MEKYQDTFQKNSNGITVCGITDCLQRHHTTLFSFSPLTRAMLLPLCFSSWPISRGSWSFTGEVWLTHTLVENTLFCNNPCLLNANAIELSFWPHQLLVDCHYEKCEPVSGPKRVRFHPIGAGTLRPQQCGHRISGSRDRPLRWRPSPQRQRRRRLRSGHL